MKLKNAVIKLTKELAEDKDLYNAYQANIAMAFKDEWSRWSYKPYKNLYDIHEISNRAAVNFLNNFIG